jgi:UDP-glucose-4-epimerase GalE
MRVLVTGGAGYIGSHTVRKLLEADHEPLVYDNLNRGHAAAVEGVPLVDGDIRDVERVARVIEENHIEAIMHFAAHSQVGESVENPGVYYENNVVGGLRLLEAALTMGVNYVVFSSSAAIYGEPVRTPIDEEHPQNPTNPYGETKVMIERALRSYDRAYGLKSVSLRYFNAAGADEMGDIGEDHSPETHLIPIVLQVALGQRQQLKVFGTDYPTPDGTCIRDYVHVNDLAQAHVLALDYLRFGGDTVACNLGNGNGYSVLEVIRAAERVVGQPIPFTVADRRTGDPAVLVASSERAKRVLGWTPQHPELNDIIATAWKWHRANPKGYAGA